jgi:ketosteroid isomerase-like protein
MATEDAAQAIEAATKSMYDSCITGDSATLGDLLCDDVAYFHSSALRDSKSSILEKVDSGLFDGMETIDWLPADTRVFGDAAVVIGTSIMTGTVGTYRMEGQTSTVLDVWRRLDGRWQLQAHHVTRKKTD